MKLKQFVLAGCLTASLLAPALAGEVVIVEHRLERGQTMAIVARQYGVPVEAVLNANPDLVPERIPVGTVIRIPTDSCAVPQAAVPPPAPPSTDPWLEVTLPDGTRAWAPRTSLLMGSRNPLDCDGVLGIARRFMGTPYRWGGMTPNGVDCSGYVQEVFELAGYVLPRLADDQYNATVSVEIADAKAGDLVFFSTYLPGPSHVGIYLGEGRFLHASSSRGVIEARLDEEYFASRYLGVRRIKPWAAPESSAQHP